jgi:23S rRNA (cytidine2498-2'-O)-methyltransferase
VDSNFVFALCQRGAEGVLKRELKRLRPAWASAYQRPGLVTFRTPEPVTPDVALDSVFARAHGISLGGVDSVEAALSLITDEEPLRLHVIERDLFRPDEEPPHVELGVLAAEVEAAFREQAPPQLRFGAAREPGELVLDVAVAPDDRWLLGLHRHALGRCPYPGGRYPVLVPDESPSRAYAKIEEAIQAFDLPFREGQLAVELGAAPGGAAYALARRGISVIAVDPADMDASALQFKGPRGAQITHLPLVMGAVQRDMLPRQVDWLLMDVHLAPQVALRSVARLVRMLVPGLRGVVFTLKLNDWSFAERIDVFLRQVGALGVVEPRARQLASHRQEIAIAGQFAPRAKR